MMAAVSESVALSPAHQGALRMAAMGIPVFPLWGIKDGKCACGAAEGRCKAGKHPRRVASFKDATTDPAIINMWFKEENLNYGVRTGVEINGSGKMLAVIDVDRYKVGGTDAFDALIAKYGQLPETAEVLTGAGGSHFYFLTDCNGDFTDELCMNVDFKVNGYVVGPGSSHVSGKLYDWEGSSDLFEGQSIADLPQWLIDHASKSVRIKIAESTEPGEQLSGYEVQRIRMALRYIEPDRYTVWLKILMALKSTADDSQAFAIADEWSQRSPKYRAEEMREKWQQIRAKGGITLGTLFDMFRKEYKARAAAVDLSRLLANLNLMWPEPQPLAQVTDSVEYPLHALPPVVRDAVVEVQQFVQAPMAMVACSALATVSLAAQSLFDVERAPSLSGPLSLYFMVVADSGERKSTLDNYFAKPVAQYEKEQAKAAEPALSDFSADMAAWEAVKYGLSDRIKRDTKEGKSIDATKVQLREHEASKPVRPAVARLVYSDTTPEALVRGIATEWPSAGLISSEGGAVFGGHGMSKDAQMRNMATINQLWDGKPIRTDRSTTASFTAEGRLTVAIQVQAPTLQAFFVSSGGLARGTGFLARFLVACPNSTQGTRRYIEPPTEWPMLERFRERITCILNQPQPVEHGRLQPPMLYLSPEAKHAWVAFYDELELQLGDGGDLHDVRDVASKTADNAARLAALFHIVEDGSGGISEHHMLGAASILRWHLNESQRVLNSTATPVGMADAAKLDKWLRAKCGEKGVAEFTVLELMQRGPAMLRKKEDLEPVLATLATLARIKVVEGNPRMVKVNPALLHPE